MVEEKKETKTLLKSGIVAKYIYIYIYSLKTNLCHLDCSCCKCSKIGSMKIREVFQSVILYII